MIDFTIKYKKYLHFFKKFDNFLLTSISSWGNIYAGHFAWESISYQAKITSAILLNLISWYASNMNEHTRNEVTTRLHLIDRFLFECLGWDREDRKTEERINVQYVDYSFY